jgi:uncharacterized protein (DUF488 family)
LIAKKQDNRLENLPENAIYTVGHSTLAIENFISLLQHYGIKHLVDIRTIARSRHNPQFNSDALAESLHKAHIEYTHMKTLGGLRHTVKDSPNTGWRNDGFRGYADYMQTEKFAQALDELIIISQKLRTAIMCAEAVPWRCHRSLVADALAVRHIPAVEILSADNSRLHKLTTFAHVKGTEITYPPKQGELL